MHWKDPTENDVTTDAYQLRAVFASILYVVTLARDQEAPHPRQNPAQIHLGVAVFQRLAGDTSLKRETKTVLYFNIIFQRKAFFLL